MYDAKGHLLVNAYFPCQCCNDCGLFTALVGDIFIYSFWFLWTLTRNNPSFHRMTCIGPNWAENKIKEGESKASIVICHSMWSAAPLFFSVNMFRQAMRSGGHDIQPPLPLPLFNNLAPSYLFSFLFFLLFQLYNTFTHTSN